MLFRSETDDDLTQILQAKKEFDGYAEGELKNGRSVRCNEYWRVICTIEQFDQCVKEMSLHKYVQIELDVYSIHEKQLLTK